MKTRMFLILFFVFCFRAVGQYSYSIDYNMALKTIDWLEHINTGADTNSVKIYFMENVALFER